MIGNPQGKRPKHMSQDNIEMDLREIGCDNSELFELSG
jgi:hypothetical protein